LKAGQLTYCLLVNTRGRSKGQANHSVSTFGIYKFYLIMLDNF